MSIINVSIECIITSSYISGVNFRILKFIFVQKKNKWIAGTSVSWRILFYIFER
jgi:hypothetical protein